MKRKLEILDLWYKFIYFYLAQKNHVKLWTNDQIITNQSSNSRILSTMLKPTAGQLMITLTVLNKNQYALFNRIQLPVKKAKHFCLLKTTNPGIRGKHSNYKVNQLLKSYTHVCFVNSYCKNKTVCRLMYCKCNVHFFGLIEVKIK